MRALTICATVLSFTIFTAVASAQTPPPAYGPPITLEAAKAKRALPSFRSLDHIEFFARLGIERGGQAPDGGTYPDRNRIGHIIVPGEPQYAALKAGE